MLTFTIDLVEIFVIGELIAQSPQLQAQVAPVLFCIRSSCKHVTEVKGP